MKKLRYNNPINPTPKSGAAEKRTRLNGFRPQPRQAGQTGRGDGLFSASYFVSEGTGDTQAMEAAAAEIKKLTP